MGKERGLDTTGENSHRKIMSSGVEIDNRFSGLTLNNRQAYVIVHHPDKFEGELSDDIKQYAIVILSWMKPDIVRSLQIEFGDSVDNKKPQ